MGEWIVLRETKANAKPFFWNMYSEEKTWEPPKVLQELGVAEVLENLGSLKDLKSMSWSLRRWSEDLDAFGIEPSPTLRNPGDRSRKHRESVRPKPSRMEAPPGFA